MCECACVHMCHTHLSCVSCPSDNHHSFQSLKDSLVTFLILESSFALVNIFYILKSIFYTGMYLVVYMLLMKVKLTHWNYSKEIIYYILNAVQWPSLWSSQNIFITPKIKLPCPKAICSYSPLPPVPETLNLFMPVNSPILNISHEWNLSKQELLHLIFTLHNVLEVLSNITPHTDSYASKKQFINHPSFVLSVSCWQLPLIQWFCSDPSVPEVSACSPHILISFDPYESFKGLESQWAMILKFLL